MTIPIFSAVRTSKKDGEYKDIAHDGAVEGDLPRAVAWLLERSRFHPDGLLVLVRTKDRDYEVIISKADLLAAGL